MAGTTRVVSRAAVMLLAAAGALAGAVPAPEARGQSPAGGDAARYTVFVSVREPVATSRPRLQALLKADGYPSHEEGETELALLLTEAEIRQLFQARVRFRSVEASASRRTLRQPYLENVTIPPRLRGLVEKIYLDPQRS